MNCRINVSPKIKLIWKAQSILFVASRISSWHLSTRFFLWTARCDWEKRIFTREFLPTTRYDWGKRNYSELWALSFGETSIVSPNGLGRSGLNSYEHVMLPSSTWPSSFRPFGRKGRIVIIHQKDPVPFAPCGSICTKTKKKLASACERRDWDETARHRCPGLKPLARYRFNKTKQHTPPGLALGCQRR